MSGPLSASCPNDIEAHVAYVAALQRFVNWDIKLSSTGAAYEQLVLISHGAALKELIWTRAARFMLEPSSFESHCVGECFPYACTRIILKSDARRSRTLRILSKHAASLRDLSPSVRLRASAPS